MDIPNRRATEILGSYESNTWLANLLAREVTHAESLLQLPFPANCLNWILGHIINGRCTALSLLDIEPIWDEALRGIYKTGSEPITADGPAREHQELLNDLEATQEKLQAGLQIATDAQLDALGVTDRGEKKIAEHLSGLAWHETFHVGQIDMVAAYIVSVRADAAGE